MPRLLGATGAMDMVMSCVAARALAGIMSDEDVAMRCTGPRSVELPQGADMH